MKLSVIIVGYNSIKYLDNCLSSINNSEFAHNREVILVDNSSKDGTVEYIKKNFKEVRIIENHDNLGFAKANNIGADNSTAEYLLFLNPDTVLKKDSLQKLLDFMEKTPDSGAVGPRLNYPDGSLQPSCRQFYNVRTILMLRTFLKNLLPDKIARENLMLNWDHSETKEVDWLLAACLMIKNEVFKKVGGYDTRYKLYFEDVDLCKRLKSAGYKNYYYPESAVVHYHQRDSARGFTKKTAWHIQSAIKYFNKHGWRF